MFRILFGGIALALGASLAVWLGYNLLIARQAEFQLNIGSFAFMAGLFYVGSKWMSEGRESMGGKFGRKKRRKKNRSVI